jgi:hypothetical protein
MLLSLVCWLLTASPRTWDALARRATRAWLVRSQFCYWQEGRREHKSGDWAQENKWRARELIGTSKADGVFVVGDFETKFSARRQTRSKFLAPAAFIG